MKNKPVIKCNKGIIVEYSLGEKSIYGIRCLCTSKACEHIAFDTKTFSAVMQDSCKTCKHYEAKSKDALEMAYL